MTPAHGGRMDVRRRDLEVSRLCKQRERWRYLLALAEGDR